MRPIALHSMGCYTFAGFSIGSLNPYVRSELSVDENAPSWVCEVWFYSGTYDSHSRGEYFLEQLRPGDGNPYW